MEEREVNRLLNRSDKYIMDKRIKLETAKNKNNEIDKLKAKFQKAEETLTKLKEGLDRFILLDRMAVEEENDYKKRRLDYLTAYINNNLNFIFPSQNLTAEIDSEVKYKSQNVSLRLIDGHGNQRIPYINEGKLFQELISFSASVGLAECLNLTSFYMDEAFAASSPENLSKVGKMLRDMLERGFQIFLIEQKDDIYKDLPRREIILHKDEIEQAVRCESIIDY